MCKMHPSKGQTNCQGAEETVKTQMTHEQEKEIRESGKERMKNCDRCQIGLIGIGMGTEETLTESARTFIADSDCVIGAKRMVEPFRKNGQENGANEGEKACIEEYRKEVIAQILRDHPEYRKVAILLSGDCGFYSGAKGLNQCLEEERMEQVECETGEGCGPEAGEIQTCETKAKKYEIQWFPGISSLQYFCAKIHKSWEDAKIISLHGTEENGLDAILYRKKTFLLLGDTRRSDALCEKLQYYQITEGTVWIGKNLSYPGETIEKKSLKDLKKEDLRGLCVAMIEREFPLVRRMGSIADEEFIRGKVPMTKSEVRSLCLAKLNLPEDGILYDIGAGTGSISVEAAIKGGNRKVYAIEQNPEGVELIRQNARKFYADQIQIVEGKAPDVLEALEAPTHAFIGGSSGNLRKILACLKYKNPQIKIVMTCISLKTLSEVMQLIEEKQLVETEILQIAVSKAKQVGSHPMMMGQNPIYLISGEVSA